MNPEPTETLDGKSLNIHQERIDQLKALFPEAFTEGQINFKKLRELLGDVVNTSTDFYELSWAGKADARAEIQRQTTATLLPLPEASTNAEANPDHVFIEGENLEVLRVLQKAYYGKVKMIYIDPPYNTGNDSFVYPDDYGENRIEYGKKAGIRNEDGTLRTFDIYKNTRENGHFHSSWLSMMYPRLFLARNLLRDDGVIFISIDDNEAANLKLLCDEIFGEENFVADITVQVNKGGRDYLPFAVTHERLLIYCKTYDSLEINEIEKEVNFVLKDERGGYELRELRNRNPKFGKHNRPNLFYPFYVDKSSQDESGLCLVSLIKNSEFSIAVLPYNSKNEESCWRWGKIKVSNNNSDNPQKTQLLARQKADGGWNIYEKNRKATAKAKTIWDESDVRTERGTIEVRELFGKPYFDHPKPTFLIKKIIKTATKSDSNDLILDFFAGSGTTAQAVMELNEEDGGNRRFMCVQLAEPTDPKSEAYKAGYHTIADITQARINKVIDKLNKKQTENLDFGNKQLLGVRSYRLAGSNFKAWQSDVATEDLEAQLEVFQNPVASTAGTPEAMLTELLLKAGLPLTVKIEKVQIADCEVFVVANDRLWVVLTAISQALIDAASEAIAKPQTLITLSNLFVGHNADELMTNAHLQLREAGVGLKVI